MSTALSATIPCTPRVYPPPHKSNSEYAPAPQWVKDFIDEYAMFPSGKNDDQVDFGAQGINWMENSKNPIADNTQDDERDKLMELLG